jgi:hypothetical protein
MSNLYIKDYPEGPIATPGLLVLDRIRSVTLTSVSPTYVTGDLRALSRQDWQVIILGTDLAVQGNQVVGGTITALQQISSDPARERFYWDGLSLPGEVWASHVASGDEAGLFALLLAGQDLVAGAEMDDVLHGYAGNDTLQGRNGNDWIDGGDGDDSIVTGTGSDTAYGGAGNDILYGEAGADVLAGQAGDDQLFGGVEADTLDGGDGSDSLVGDAGDDVLLGGAGNDTAQGGVENDRLEGGDGDDRLFGAAGDDLLLGGAGADLLDGDIGADRLDGGDGADTLNGGNGNDVLLGGAGNDYLDGGENPDLLAGGAGDDVLVGGGSFDEAGFALLRHQFGGVTGNNSERIATSPEGTDTLRSIEGLIFIDGRLELDGGGEGAAVYRLYTAGLGRPADPIGLGYWVTQLDAGASLNAIGQLITGSAEFADRFGAPGNADFVRLLYQLSLGRDPDPDGQAYWTTTLDAGTPRGDMLAAFSQTPEHIDRVGQPDADGLWIPAPDAVDAVRYYQAVYDRLPDAGGLVYWTEQRATGLTLREMGDLFTAAPEFQATYGSLDNAGFVALLYENALGRPADAGGLGFWTGILDRGEQSRSQVVEGFAFSGEMTVLITPRVSDGIDFS